MEMENFLSWIAGENVSIFSTLLEHGNGQLELQLTIGTWKYSIRAWKWTIGTSIDNWNLELQSIAHLFLHRSCSLCP
jgi:hypothetical protein